VSVPTSNQILERLASEVALPFLVALWVTLRVGGVIRKSLQKSGAFGVRLGKFHAVIHDGRYEVVDTRLTPPEKEKIEVIDESGKPKQGNLT